MKTVNWPSESGEYKAMQIYFGEEPYLRIGYEPESGSSGDFHGTILMRFLRSELDILDHGWILAPPLMMTEIPDSEDKEGRYEAVGAIKLKIDAENKTLRECGRSKNYPTLYFNSEHMDAILEKEESWTRD